jgi:hypothetical protein
MGGQESHEYHEAGKRHGDTKAYKDEDVLASHGHMPNRITAIRVWWSEYCVGIEVFYDGVSAGARVGSEYSQGTVYSDFVMAEGEYISEVSGRNGDLVDQFTIHTTLGRSQQFGTSTGGHAFRLKAHGKVVKGFTVGFGGHLHFIGANFNHLVAPVVKSGKAGKTHGDTAHFDDFESHLKDKGQVELTEIRVLHDGNMVYGVEGIYTANGVQYTPGVHVGKEMTPSTINQSVSLHGKHITGISGRNGDIVDNLTLTLSDGATYSFGGQGGNAFGNIVPAGKKVVALGGGLGGHLHNLYCYTQ